VISTLDAALDKNHALGGIPANTATPFAGIAIVLADGTVKAGAVTTGVEVPSFGS